MTNASKFKLVFGINSEEFWSKSKRDMLSWNNSEFPEHKESNGKWKHFDVSSVSYFLSPMCECSICGAIVEQESQFCPNCGTKMDLH